MYTGTKHSPLSKHYTLNTNYLYKTPLLVRGKALPRLARYIHTRSGGIHGFGEEGPAEVGLLGV
jgi:hypothetical protein